MDIRSDAQAVTHVDQAEISPTTNYRITMRNAELVSKNAFATLRRDKIDLTGLMRESLGALWSKVGTLLAVLMWTIVMDR